MSMIRFTPEQADIIDWIAVNEGTVLVSAGAGTGKTFLAHQIVLFLKPFRGLYTAFNKAIVQEGAERFKDTSVESRTLHALARHHVLPYLKNTDINELSYTCITEDIPYSDKYEIISAINDFYVSASTDMEEFMDFRYKDNKKGNMLKPITLNYINKMVAGEINPTFNFLLKYFHLMLHEGSLKVEYDLMILDEINDTTAVALEIFKNIKAKHKVGLGETHQAIYKFLNLVDGFEALKDTTIFSLTNSFRCSVEIADRINRFMKKEADEEFQFSGTDEPVKNGKKLYVTSTNGAVIMEINKRLEANKSFTLLRKPQEIFAYPLAIITAQQGKVPYNKKYKFLVEEFNNYTKNKRSGYSFLKHLTDNVGDEETKSAVNLLIILTKKGINFFDLYKRAKNISPDAKYTIATVYTSKGLEYETVEIAEDLTTRILSIRANGGIHNEEDLVAYRCYYVACSRAGTTLLNATALPD